MRSRCVSSSKVAPNSVTSGYLARRRWAAKSRPASWPSEIATNGVAGTEIATNGVQGDEIENGSLIAANLGQFSGSVGRNFGAIPGGTGQVRLHRSHSRPGQHRRSRRPRHTGAGSTGNVSFPVEAEGTQLRLKACKPSGAVVGPDGRARTTTTSCSGENPME